jgi:hypothetical protein
MSKYKVTNLTQGRLELKSVNKTLLPGGWVAVTPAQWQHIQLHMNGRRGSPRVKGTPFLEKGEAAVAGPSAAPAPASSAPKAPVKTKTS